MLFSDEIMFPIKFLLESLRIHCIDTWYHAHQYVCDYKLIYFIVLSAIWDVFRYFTYKC